MARLKTNPTQPNYRPLCHCSLSSLLQSAFQSVACASGCPNRPPRTPSHLFPLTTPTIITSTASLPPPPQPSSSYSSSHAVASSLPTPYHTHTTNHRTRPPNERRPPRFFVFFLWPLVWHGMGDAPSACLRLHVPRSKVPFPLFPPMHLIVFAAARSFIQVAPSYYPCWQLPVLRLALAPLLLSIRLPFRLLSLVS